MYLPLVGLIAPCVVGGYALWQRTGSTLGVLPRAGPALVVGLVVIVLAARTAMRNEDYRSQLSLWETVVRQWPLNARVHRALGIALTSDNRLEEALVQFESAHRLEPDHFQAEEPI